MDLCEVCATPLQRAQTGRRRRYCSDRCRNQAKRERDAALASTPLLSDPVDDAALRTLTAVAVADVLAAEPPRDPVERLTRAVGETETLAVEYARLARVTPPNLSARADGMATHLRDGLDRLFPREDRP